MYSLVIVGNERDDATEKQYLTYFFEEDLRQKAEFVCTCFAIFD